MADKKARIERAAVAFDQPGQVDMSAGIRYAAGIVDARLRAEVVERMLKELRAQLRAADQDRARLVATSLDLDAECRDLRAQLARRPLKRPLKPRGNP